MAALLSLAGCSEEAGDGTGLTTPSGNSGDGTNPTAATPAPDFPSGQGQAEKGSSAYPAGPYGIAKGSVVSNYQFVGFANFMEVSDSMQAIQLADFYNPHADDPSYNPANPSEDDRLFAADSPYGAGAKKPKVLLIDVASVWCGPCNAEAANVLPGLHAKYKPCGGDFLLQLADGPNSGTAASPTNLINWTKKYKVDYPATIDPTYKLGALFDQNAFPANMIVDTRTMTIVEIIAGVPDQKFWTKYETILNDSSCLAGTTGN